MTFAELVTELQARGFFDDDATRAGVYINQARARLDGMYLWPYREKSATGTAPLSITDLGTIEAVTNEDLGYPLQPGDYRSLLEENGDLSVTGTPTYFYVAWPAGTPEVAVYPTSTATIGVQYYRVPVDIATTDQPAAPVRFHSVILDLAQQRAYIDRDNLDAARALQPFIDQQVGQMVEELLGGQQIVGAQIRQQMTWDACDA